MKRITFFHPMDDNYGSSNILVFILSFLAKDYECVVYLPKISGAMQKLLQELTNERVIFKEYPDLPLAHRAMFTPSGLLTWLRKNIKTFRLIRQLKSESDLLYVNTLSLFSVCLLSKLSGNRSLMHCHEYLKGTIYGKAMRLVTYLSADGVICVSDKVKSFISVGKSRKYLIVHNGIPETNFDDTQQQHSSTQTLKVAFIGRVMPEKGHWFLLDALAKLDKAALSKLEFHVFGDAPPTSQHLFQDFKKALKAQGFEEHFVLHGFDRNASAKINKFDFCLVPSMVVDSFPTTVLEAMRAERLVISTNHGGAAEVVKDKQTGLLVEPGNTLQLAEALRFCVENKTEVKRIGENAGSYFKAHCTVERFRERYLEALKLYV